jgi:hypothetical protein
MIEPIAAAAILEHFQPIGEWGLGMTVLSNLNFASLIGMLKAHKVLTRGFERSTTNGR